MKTTQVIFEDFLSALADTACKFYIETCAEENIPTFEIDVEKLEQIIRKVGCDISDFWGITDVKVEED